MRRCARPVSLSDRTRAHQVGSTLVTNAGLQKRLSVAPNVIILTMFFAASYYGRWISPLCFWTTLSCWRSMQPPGGSKSRNSQRSRPPRQFPAKPLPTSGTRYARLTCREAIRATRRSAILRTGVGIPLPHCSKSVGSSRLIVSSIGVATPFLSMLAIEPRTAIWNQRLPRAMIPS